MDSFTNANSIARRRLVVRGQVQGVGFRPFVYRLATELAIGGFVRNDGIGVTIELQGDPPVMDAFTRRLRSDLPPIARIDRLEEGPVAPVAGSSRFEILFSDHSQTAGAAKAVQADVTPDIATCPDCLAELFDPADRRFGYPFINCTNCGPRYSIVKDVPYDRPKTTMDVFPMCPACRAEYDNPADRRFHAQPNACPVCGPRIWLEITTDRRLAVARTRRHGEEHPFSRESPDLAAGGHQRAREHPSPQSDSREVVRCAAQALLAGRILAIRGVGGFHLAARADQDEPVARLRERKNREHKPLAIMAASVEAAEQFVELTPAAREILTSPQRPIVIARRREGSPASRHIAPGTDSLGVMLPYTPLHHLLFAEIERRKDHHGSKTRLATASLRSVAIPLVMTSGNLSDEPIVAGLDEARAALGQVADLFLMHDREIHRRIDDSVVEVVGQSLLPLRRARGYVPVGIDLTGAAPEQGLAVGGELKNTVAVVRNRGDIGQVILSEHVGDLKDGRAYRHFEQIIAHLAQITHTVPQWIAHDMHPMYLSSVWARRQGLRLIPVQHHHAHIAACLAEHSRFGPAIGLAADGVGYGPDGEIWGGEILLADLCQFRRLGRVRPIGLPGGDAAAIQTGRPAVAWLFDATDGKVPQRWLDRLLAEPAERDVVLRQLSENFNCPASSALGRYFDAVAAILDLAAYNRFEAEAPVALEAAIEPGCDESLPFEIAGRRAGHGDAGTRGRGELFISASPRLRVPASADSAAEPFEIDLRPAVLALVDRVDHGVAAGKLAAAFHNTIAAALAAAAERAGELTGVRTVACSGGVFCNRYLTLRLTRLLADERGMEVLTHRQLPCNDGGLAAGQAAVATARLAGLKSSCQ